MANITCPSCGGQKATQINDNEYRCEYCSHIFQKTSSQQSSYPQQGTSPQPLFQNAFTETSNANGKTRTTAAILAILLGGFGAHQFYLGNIGKGILYLVFCWTYIPSIIGLIEGIMLITQSDEEFISTPKLLI